MTNKIKMLTEIAAIVNSITSRKDLVEFLNKEIETLKQRKKKDDLIKESKEIRSNIIDILSEAIEPISTHELAKQLNVSIQKVTFVLQDMIYGEEVVTTLNKKKDCVYQLPE